MQTEREDVIAALRVYHDIPAMIAEEWGTIRNCQEQREKIGATAAKLRETNGAAGSGEHGDKTARLAIEDRDTLFQKESDDRLLRIDELRCTREWLRVALSHISRQDRYILDLAFIGPSDAAQRRG